MGGRATSGLAARLDADAHRRRSPGIEPSCRRHGGLAERGHPASPLTADRRGVVGIPPAGHPRTGCIHGVTPMARFVPPLDPATLTNNGERAVAVALALLPEGVTIYHGYLFLERERSRSGREFFREGEVD